MEIELDTAQAPLCQAALKGMRDEVLAAQEISQQGAVHAISFLLVNGCNETVAAQMLASLRSNADLIRQEVVRRGRQPLFSQDQTVFS